MECLDIFSEQVVTKDYDIKLHIKSKQQIDDNTIYFIAANPPDYRTTFSGSALPFHNKTQAFDNTINKGKIILNALKEGTIYLKYPNSYYIDLGNILVVSHVDFIFKVNNVEKMISYKLSKYPIPYRSLTHPHTRTSPLFYKPIREADVMSQSDLFIKKGYPLTNTPINEFW